MYCCCTVAFTVRTVASGVNSPDCTSIENTLQVNNTHLTHLGLKDRIHIPIKIIYAFVNNTLISFLFVLVCTSYTQNHTAIQISKPQFDTVPLLPANASRWHLCAITDYHTTRECYGSLRLHLTLRPKEARSMGRAYSMGETCVSVSIRDTL